MYADSARVTPLSHLLLGVVPRERHIVARLVPIHVASRGRVPVFDVEPAREAYVPVVVHLDEVRLEPPVHMSGGRSTRVPPTVWDIISESPPAVTLFAVADAAITRDLHPVPASSPQRPDTQRMLGPVGRPWDSPTAGQVLEHCADKTSLPFVM